MITSGRDEWLSLTPEPERELPGAVATLRAGGSPAPDAVACERRRIERLVVRARQRAWLSYLTEVVTLIETTAASTDPAVADARAVAIQVVANHHGLLLGLRGRAAERTADVRSRLEDVLVN
jgi:hypothetical protein